MAFIPTQDRGLFAVDPEAARSKGKELSEAYNSAAPFPHVVIDDFLPRPVIDYCLEHFPRELDPEGREYDRDQERYKRSFNPDFLDDPQLRALFYTFNARPFISVIENITGIKGLIPDPHFLGGGFHEIGQGGHLSMHADFNHHKPMGLERRINALIYLNDDWRDEYGGQLELWDSDMNERVVSVVPEANRCVIFTTTQESMHGNPNPIAHPERKPRRSIALYYYTSTWDDEKKSKSTQFHARPGTEDRTDWKVKSREFVRDYVPPAFQKNATRLVNRLIK